MMASISLPLTERVFRWISKQIKNWDPALHRTTDEERFEAAVQKVAERFNLQYVPQHPVVGVPAEVRFKVGGLSVCGVNGVRQTGIPTRTMVRCMESHITQLCKDIDWDFEITSEH